MSQACTVVVLGASGDLAKKKTFPALFSLYVNKNLPGSCRIVGYARSDYTNDAFHERIKPSLKGSPEEIAGFLSICSYHQGSYDTDAGFRDLDVVLRKAEAQHAQPAVRIFYMALPPSVFATVAKHLRHNCYLESGKNRIIVEKPFGRDLESCRALINDIKSLWSEDETYRIDHYLGKEMVKNIPTFRFGNPIIENMFNSTYVDSVQISFKEPFGTEGRGGYFDEFGIIRDIQQNHLCQVFSLLAMDQPVDFSAEAVRNAKVDILKKVEPVRPDEVLIGQYVAANGKAGYKDDETVPRDSRTPTFAALVLRINNDRWRGVPFILKAGKALDEGKVEIRIQFKEAHMSIPGAARDELVMRIQPGEAAYIKVNTKLPGVGSTAAPVELDLTYASRFRDMHIPEAYEALILDALREDHSNFVRDDELLESWAIFTPVLHAIDRGEFPVAQYPFGSRGPEEIDEFMERLGYRRSERYEWPKANVQELSKV